MNNEKILEMESCRKVFAWKSLPHDFDNYSFMYHADHYLDGHDRIYEKGGLNADLTETYGYTSTPSILLSIMTIILNVFIIDFYRKTELTVVSLLYTLIASMDIIFSVGSIYQYITLGLCVRADVGAGKPFDVNSMIFLFLMQVSYRCSVFCNLVLAVSRTIMIVKPFYEINKKAVMLVCVLNAVPWTALYCLNIYIYIERLPSLEDLYLEVFLRYNFLIGYGLADITLFTVMDFGYSFDNFYLNFFLMAMFFLPDLLAFIIPVIIVIITCIIQIRSIWRSSQFPNRANQRHVTITVLLMSTLFVICNSPLSVYIATLLYDTLYNIQMKTGIQHISIGTIFPLLNGVLNPVIIISRSSEMRRKFKNILLRMRWWDRAEQE